MRKELFQRIVRSLATAKGENVKLSSFLAGICLETGLKKETVAELFSLGVEAGIWELSDEEDWVRLVGAEA